MLSDDLQAREDAILKMIEAGLVPGVVASGMPIPGVDCELIVYRIRREMAEAGRTAGHTVGDLLRDIPDAHHGRVLLAFDGWASDPRPLAFVPEVVDFCAGMLLGRTLGDVEHAAAIMKILLNEALLVNAGIDRHVAYDASGCLWLVAHAYADSTIVLTKESPSGIAKDISIVLEIATSLLGRRLPTQRLGCARLLRRC